MTEKIQSPYLPICIGVFGQAVSLILIYYLQINDILYDVDRLLIDLQLAALLANLIGARQELFLLTKKNTGAVLEINKNYFFNFIKSHCAHLLLCLIISLLYQNIFSIYFIALGFHAFIAVTTIAVFKGDLLGSAFVRCFNVLLPPLMSVILITGFGIQFSIYDCVFYLAVFQLIFSSFYVYKFLTRQIEFVSSNEKSFNCLLMYGSGLFNSFFQHGPLILIGLSSAGAQDLLYLIARLLNAPVTIFGKIFGEYSRTLFFSDQSTFFKFERWNFLLLFGGVVTIIVVFIYDKFFLNIFSVFFRETGMDTFHIILWLSVFYLIRFFLVNFSLIPISKKGLIGDFYLNLMLGLPLFFLTMIVFYSSDFFFWPFLACSYMMVLTWFYIFMRAQISV